MSDEIVTLLETYLRYANEGKLQHVVIAAAVSETSIASDFAGDISIEPISREAVRVLAAKLDTSIWAWTPPPRNEALDASYVCYNLAASPLGFDFLNWLVDAEMVRRRENAPGPLKVGFFLGNAVQPVQRAERLHWLNKVFRPLLPMIGAVEDSEAVVGRARRSFLTGDIVAAAKRGEEVPRLQVEGAKEHGAVTITLRESSHWSHRNSNLEGWLRFADDLMSSGERVVFVRDTEKAAEPLTALNGLKRFITDPLAAVDLTARQALYQGAKANLFVSNGPAAMAVYGDKPWLQFITIEPEESLYRSNTASFWKERHGVAPGERYPWALPSQRLVCAADSYENITEAWRALPL